MKRAVRIGLTALLGLGCFGPGCGSAARAQDAGLLSDPGDYSFAPPAYRQGGVADVSVGSHNMRSTSIRMDSGLIGNTGTRAFVALGAGQGPDLLRGQNGSRIGIASHGAAIGLEKVFADGTTVSIEGDWAHDRLTAGRTR